MPLQSILLIGADSSLLCTRSLVLARCGVAVESATLDQALPLIASGAYDLLVLCHSLRDGELEDLSAAARASAPAMKILLVEAPGHILRQPLDVDRHFALEDGPELLVKAVKSLLAQVHTPTVAAPIVPFAVPQRLFAHAVFRTKAKK